MSTFLLSYYGEVLTHPNQYSFSPKGDGIKNYFVFIAAIKSQDPSLEIEYMNYPYGEGLLFVDAHPALALVLASLSKPFPNLHEYGVGILNFLMIFSLLITAFILKGIFGILKVQPWLSILGAFAITLLNAQIFRMHGHFALAYGFFVPSIIYGILQIEIKGKGRFWYLYLSFLAVLYFFTHAYAGLISSVLIIIYSGIKLLSQLKDKRNLLASVYLALSGIAPVGIFYSIAKAFDKHTGRTSNPWGLFEYHADLETVFLPILGPFNPLKGKWFGPIHQTEEGWAYVGVMTIIGLLFLICRSAWYSLKNKTLSFDRFLIQDKPIRILLLTSIFVLMLSMLIPIRFGLEVIVDWFPIIKQFRSIGRFAVVFYFGSTITIIVIANALFTYLEEKKQLLIAYFLLLFVPGLMYAESIALHEDMSHNITRSKNLFQLENNSPSFQNSIVELSDKDFQAVLILPFFCQGSENFGVIGDEQTLQLGFLSSYYLDLPLIGNASARSSIWESKNMMQLLSSGFYKKSIINEFSDSLPILVAARKIELHPNEKEIVRRSSLIYDGDDFAFYEISKEELFSETNSEEINRFQDQRDELIEKDGFLVSDTTKHFQFNDFGNPFPIDFENNSNSAISKQKQYFNLLTIEPNTLEKGNYIARFWMYNNGENYGQNQLTGIVFLQKSFEGKLNWVSITDPKESFEINGNWSLVEVPINYDQTDAKYSLVYIGDTKSEKEVYFKDFLFYDAGLEIYKIYSSKDKQFLFKNNHRVQF